MNKKNMTRHTLRDLVQIKNGRDHKDLGEGHIPVFGSGGIMRFADKAIYNEESILLPRKGTLSNIQYVNKPFWTVDTIYYTIVNTKLTNTYFLYNYLKLLDLSWLNSGTGVPSMTFDAYYDLEVYLPELTTQQKIASVLSSLDSKIELNNRINAELESMAKTLYDYWFVQFDFPNANGKPYKTSGGKMVWNEELKREVPEGWGINFLSEIFEFNPSLSLKKGAVSSYIDMDALPNEGYMTKEVQKKEFNGGVKFQNGDLVIARITPCLENGKTGLVTLLDDDEIGFGSTEFIVLRGKTRSLSGFASMLSRSDLFRKYAITNMTGTSGRKRVDAKNIEKYKLAIPKDNLLEKFESIIVPFFQKMTVNTIENQKLTELRDWLLPMLMNGQVKVN
jgi:type I restriction enzyme S subunit